MCGVSPLVVNQAANRDPWGGKGLEWGGGGILQRLTPERVKTLGSLLSSRKMPLLPRLPLRFGGITMLPSHRAACVGIDMCGACACLHTS